MAMDLMQVPDGHFSFLPVDEEECMPVCISMILTHPSSVWFLLLLLVLTCVDSQTVQSCE